MSSRGLTQPPWPRPIRRQTWRLLKSRHDRRAGSSLTTQLVTSTGRDDGGGAQIHGQLSTVAFARAHGLKYVHSALSSVAHNPGIPEVDWTSSWERYFSLSAFSTGSEQASAAPIAASAADVLKGSQAPSACWNLPHCHAYTDLFPESLNQLRQELRTCIASSREVVRLEHFVAGSDSIAVHVRRGDVNATSHPERYTSGRSSLQLAKEVRRISNNSRAIIYMFAQSPDQDILDLESEDVRIIIEPDVFRVIDHMVAATHLVMAKSSLSYLAGLVRSRGTVYQPFWHPPMPDWAIASRTRDDVVNIRKPP